MQTSICTVVTDGDETLIAMPEKKTVEFYQYLRSFGFCFTVHSRGFCEDNVFSFPEGENLERLKAIVAKFPVN
jgi:hypothetical protein